MILKLSPPWLPLLWVSSFALAACAATETDQPAAALVPEVRPGILQGYLAREDHLHSEAFIPPAPLQGSAVQQLDDAVSRYALTLYDTPRWNLASQDTELHFPAAANIFSCALDFDVDEVDTPALYRLLRRTLPDLGLATGSAKNIYQRPRPFTVNEAPICTPDDEEKLRHSGSYPSGHVSVGWGWALILAELVPHRSEAILARGRAFGESRVVCNLHWYSDVVAGRMVAAAVVAELHANAEFDAAMQLARADVTSVSERSFVPTQKCAQESLDLELNLDPGL